MSPAVKPRPAAALEVTFQCHKGTCLQPQAYLGHTQTSLVEGVGLAMAKSLPHLTRSHKTPFRAAKTPLVCTVAPIIYLLLPARNGGMTLVAGSVHHFPLGQHPSSQHSVHPCAWFLGTGLQRNNRHKAEGSPQGVMTTDHHSLSSCSIPPTSLFFQHQGLLSAVHYLLHSVYFCAF